MSITYFPIKKSLYVLIYGCDPDTKQRILARLKNSEDSTCHPLLFPGIFAELERKRQLDLVKHGLEVLHTTIMGLGRYHKEWKEDPIEDSQMDDAIDPWLEIHHLKNSLEAWKRQLMKIAAHADELSETWFKIDSSDSEGIKEEKLMVRRTGDRIQERILEIIDDYDDKIRECIMIMEGMTLATQMVTNTALIRILDN